jgi:uncharacterized protein
MANIIDRRKNGKGKSAPNRKKFIERYKRQIKKAIDKLADGRNIKDIVDSGTISISDTSEPTFHHDPNSGDSETVYNGNTHWVKGDTIPKPQKQNSSGSGGGGDDDQDDFTFTLTKEEFYDLYFDGMELPRFVKDSMKNSVDFKNRRAGYTKDGIPARLNLKKTFEQAIGRKLAAKAQGKKPIFLDDSDLRYNYFTQDPVPIRHAVIFFLMDVSASMREPEKAIAKKFFLLMYLFLTTQYESVELVFIRHTESAQEVDEEEFFHGKQSGGTVVASAFELMLKIIEARFDQNTTNFYVAQASDGDVEASDAEEVINMLDKTILPMVQYMVYIEVANKAGTYMSMMYESLYKRYKSIKHKNFKSRLVTDDSKVYAALHDLFKKGAE